MVPDKTKAFACKSERKRNSGKYDFNIIPAARLNPEEFSPRTTGYLALDTGKNKVIRATVYNVADANAEINAGLSAVSEYTGGKLVKKFPATRISSQGNVTFEWKLTHEIQKKLAGPSTFKLTMKSGEKEVLPLVMKVWFEMPLKEQLEKFSFKKRLPLEQLNRWERLAAPEKGLSLEMKNNIWTMQADLPVNKNSWAFPRFLLPDDFDMSKASGMVIKIRNTASSMNNLMMLVWENDDVAYATPSSLAPVDGRWHVIYIPFNELVHNKANAPDENEKLDLDMIRKVSIGVYGANAENNTIEISDWYIVNQE